MTPALAIPTFPAPFQPVSEDDVPSVRSSRPATGQFQTCSKCDARQDLCEFAVKRGGRARICRTCQKAVSDAHYIANREQRLLEAAERNDHRKEILRLVRDVYLGGCECENCGTTENLKLRAKPEFKGKAAWVVIGSAHKVELLIDAMKESWVLCEACVNPTGLRHKGVALQAQA